MFADLEHFVMAHRRSGELIADVGEPEPEGYLVSVACSCGAAFDRWVTPGMADRDLLRSRLLAHSN